MSPRSTVLSFGACLLAACSALPARAAEITVELASGARLTLSVPADWHNDSKSSGPGTTIQFYKSPASDQPTLLVTVFRRPPDSPISTPAALRASVEVAGNSLLPTALQKHLELEELRPAGGSAFCYHLTDRNEEKGPGDFREMSQGVMLLEDHLLTFTILTHPGEDSLVQTAKSVVTSAALSVPR